MFGANATFENKKSVYQNLHFVQNHFMICKNIVQRSKNQKCKICRHLFIKVVPNGHKNYLIQRNEHHSYNLITMVKFRCEKSKKQCKRVQKGIIQCCLGGQKRFLLGQGANVALKFGAKVERGYSVHNLSTFFAKITKFQLP